MVEIQVSGSNRAVYGRGEGLKGLFYVIPTKNVRSARLPLHEVAQGITRFLVFAAAHPDWQFQLTRIGCAIAEFSDAEVAPLFRGAPLNVHLPERWEMLIGRH